MPGYNSQRRGTARTLPNVLCCSIYSLFCVVVCKCVLYYCRWVATKLQLTNYISYQIVSYIISYIIYHIIYIPYHIYHISYIVSYHIISYIVSYHHTMSCHVTSRHIMSCHVMSCHVMLCHVIYHIK
jgi:hypothetical protein